MPKWDRDRAIWGAVRRAYRRCPVYSQARLRSRREFDQFNKDGSLSKRKKVRYECAGCGALIRRKDIEIDHIDPVVPIGRHMEDMSWRELFSRLFCSVDNLQVLCKKCHREKTGREKKERMKT